MSLLKRWRGHDGHGDEERQGAMEKRSGESNVLGRLRGEMDRLWRESDRDPWGAMMRVPESLGRASHWPAMDMTEDDKAVTIRLDVPGLEARDVDVEVSGNQLSIRGRREEEIREEEKGVHRRERYSGSFARTVTLPSYVDSNRVDARFDKGTLTITAPKIPGQGPRRVEVKG